MDAAIELGVTIAAVAVLALFVGLAVRHKWRQMRRDYRFESLLDDPSQDPVDLMRAWADLSPWVRDEMPWLDPRLTTADRSEVREIADDASRRAGGNTHSGALAAYSAVRALLDHGIPIADTRRRQRIALRVEEAEDIFGPDVSGYSDGFAVKAEYISRKVAEDDAAERGG